jgi:hypothetical protein
MGPGKTHEAIETIAGVTVSSVQFQPTDRPIEDRFSITVSPDGARLMLGVYDGTADNFFWLNDMDTTIRRPQRLGHCGVY